MKEAEFTQLGWIPNLPQLFQKDGLRIGRVPGRMAFDMTQEFV